MRLFFALTGIVFWLIAAGGCTISTSAVHQISYLICGVIGTLFIVGAGIVEALEKLARQPKPPASPK